MGGNDLAADSPNVLLAIFVGGGVLIAACLYGEALTKRWRRHSAARDEEAVKANPGNGPRVVRLMLKAAKVEELDALHGDFKAVAHRTEETKVEAAYWWKRAQLQDSDSEEYWWDFLRAFHDETTEYRDAVASEISRLEEAQDTKHAKAWWSWG